MKLADIIFSVQSEIDNVSTAEIIHRLNTFILKHRVSKRITIEITETGFNLPLDSNSVYINEIFYNDEKLGCGLTRQNYVLHLGNVKQYNVFPEGFIGFNFELKIGDKVYLYADVINDKFSLDALSLAELPYPDAYEYPITCFILKELFKSLKYLNPDLLGYYDAEYRKQISIVTHTPLTNLTKSIGTW